jgi:hypothetical protein
MHDEFMQIEEHSQKQHRNNDQFNARLDSILATLQTIVNNKKDEKFNGRNNPVFDGIIPNPKSNIWKRWILIKETRWDIIWLFLE